MFVPKRREVTVKLVKGHKGKDPNNPNRAAFSGYLPIEEVIKLAEGSETPWCNPRLGYSPNKEVERVHPHCQIY